MKHEIFTANKASAFLGTFSHRSIYTVHMKTGFNIIMEQFLQKRNIFDRIASSVGPTPSLLCSVRDDSGG